MAWTMRAASSARSASRQRAHERAGGEQDDAGEDAGPAPDAVRDRPDEELRDRDRERGRASASAARWRSRCRASARSPGVAGASTLTRRAAASRRDQHGERRPRGRGGDRQASRLSGRGAPPSRAAATASRWRTCSRWRCRGRCSTMSAMPTTRTGPALAEDSRSRPRASQDDDIAEGRRPPTSRRSGRRDDRQVAEGHEHGGAGMSATSASRARRQFLARSDRTRPRSSRPPWSRR